MKLGTWNSAFKITKHLFGSSKILMSGLTCSRWNLWLGSFLIPPSLHPCSLHFTFSCVPTMKMLKHEHRVEWHDHYHGSLLKGHIRQNQTTSHQSLTAYNYVPNVMYCPYADTLSLTLVLIMKKNWRIEKKGGAWEISPTYLFLVFTSLADKYSPDLFSLFSFEDYINSLYNLYQMFKKYINEKIYKLSMPKK